MQLHITEAEKPEGRQRHRSRENLVSPVHKLYLQGFNLAGRILKIFLFLFFTSMREGHSQGRAE